MGSNKGWTKPWRGAACHPDRKYYAHDLCKICYDASKPKRKQKPEVGRRKNAKVKFNLTLEAYDALIASAKVCGSCGKPFGSPKELLDLVLDHDHVTRAIRAVLHRRCNAALGMLYDSADVCRLAAEYLERHK